MPLIQLTHVNNGTDVNHQGNITKACLLSVDSRSPNHTVSSRMAHHFNGDYHTNDANTEYLASQLLNTIIEST